MALAVSEASSSSPPSSAATPRLWTYHAFLSFRGEDTRKSFTGHLYAALDRKGIKTFRDDKYLETGEVIYDELVKAIEESMFAIIVLSPNYASSSWCLDELSHIVECSKSIGLEVVPVFYGVEPSDVRYQKGSFQEAFKKHERRFGEDSEKVRRWRDALAQVASLSGWDSNHQHEPTLVECIAEHIQKKMIPKLPSFTRNLVGIDSRVKEVISHIGIGLNDVRFIGIWGMGGIGKTTIARSVYEAIQCEFKVTCFLENVREGCEKKDIVEMQRKLLHQANASASTLYGEYDGQRIIQNSLCNKNVLLVLDDISDEEQLKNLAGQQDWFGPGSRIIVTTRDVHLLNILEVYQTYEVQGLVQNESSDLFCLEAFKQKSPIKGYLDLSKEMVKYSGGLPLALKVLGSHLRGKSIDFWYSTIEKIKKKPLDKIYDRLKISYDELDDMEKNIFLHIACFFSKGTSKYYVADVLNKCGYSAENGIDILIDRSLVTLNQNSKLDMHDLLQDMGRSIVIQESPNDPSRRSKLWSSKDIDLVLMNNKVTEKIQSIVLYNCKAEWCARDFSNMTQLKLLIMHSWPSINGRDLDMRFPDGPNCCLPTSLKVLHLPSCYPLKTLPIADSQQYELVEIKLLSSEIEQAWQGKKFLPNLKYLDLSGSYKLKETPDLSAASVLETLLLERCSSLKEVHPSVAHHKKLTILNLTGCSALTTLPGKLEMSSLVNLTLDHCLRLQDLPEFGECMKSLSRLSLRRTKIRELPTSLGCLVGLKELNLQGCENLMGLPDITDRFSLKISGAGKHKNLPLLTPRNLSGKLKNLPLSTALNLSGEHKNLTLLRAPNLSGKHKNLPLLTAPNLSGEHKNLPLLTALNLSGKHKNLPLLTTPNLSGKHKNLPLLTTPNLSGEHKNLLLLTTLNLSGCLLTEEAFPHDFWGPFPSLMDLDLSGNCFVEIPRGIHELQKLKFLKLNSCSKIRFLPELPSSIRFLEACDCDSLDISEFNTSSNVFGAFVSRSQDDGHVLREMVISGRKIPPRFVHRKDGDTVSIPCCDYPLNQRLGIALSFLIQTHYRRTRGLRSRMPVECVWAIYDANKELISNASAPLYRPGNHLYIICLTNDYLIGRFHQGDCIEFSLKLVQKSSIANKCGHYEESIGDYRTRVTSAARWVNIEDTRGLNKSKIELPMKEEQKYV